MLSTYIAKSLKGLSIITNLNIEESCNINCTLTTRTYLDIGTESNHFRSIFVDNINGFNPLLNLASEDPIKLVYDDASKVSTIGLKFDTLRLVLLEGSLSVIDFTVSNPLLYSNDNPKNLSLKIKNSLTIIDGELAINDSYIRNLFVSEDPIKITNIPSGSITYSRFSLKIDPIYLALNISGSLSFSEAFLIQFQALQAAVNTAIPASIAAEIARAELAETLLSVRITSNSVSIGLILATLTGYETSFTTIDLISTNLNVSNAFIKARLDINTDLNAFNKILTLYDVNISDPANATDFFGFGINPYVMRYQSPIDTSHKFYVGTNLIFEIGNNIINSNNDAVFNTIRVAGSTNITQQGGYLEWNRSGGGGELVITNQIGGGNDPSIYLALSNTSNVRTKMWQFYPNGITSNLSGNNFFNINNGGTFIFGYNENSNFQVYNSEDLTMRIQDNSVFTTTLDTGLLLCQTYRQFEQGEFNIDSPGVSGGRLRIDLSSNLILSGADYSGNKGFIQCNSIRCVNRGQTNYFGDVLPGNIGFGNGCVNIGSGSPAGSQFLTFYNSGFGAVGSVTYNAAFGVSFNTSSDYRIKTNVKKLTNSLKTINLLKPKTYSLFENKIETSGFIAHEIQEILPSLVLGEKDAVFEDGSPNYQQVDLTKIIPYLVGAVQELTLQLDIVKKRML